MQRGSSSKSRFQGRTSIRSRGSFSRHVPNARDHDRSPARIQIESSRPHDPILRRGPSPPPENDFQNPSIDSERFNLIPPQTVVNTEVISRSHSHNVGHIIREEEVFHPVVQSNREMEPGYYTYPVAPNKEAGTKEQIFVGAQEIFEYDIGELKALNVAIQRNIPNPTLGVPLDRTFDGNNIVIHRRLGEGSTSLFSNITPNTNKLSDYFPSEREPDTTTAPPAYSQYYPPTAPAAHEVIPPAPVHYHPLLPAPTLPEPYPPYSVPPPNFVKPINKGYPEHFHNPPPTRHVDERTRASIYPEPSSTSIYPEPPRTPMYPEPSRMSIYPESSRTSIYPESSSTSMYPEPSYDAQHGPLIRYEEERRDHTRSVDKNTDHREDRRSPPRIVSPHGRSQIDDRHYRRSRSPIKRTIKERIPHEYSPKRSRSPRSAARYRSRSPVDKVRPKYESRTNKYHSPSIDERRRYEEKRVAFPSARYDEHRKEHEHRSSPSRDYKRRSSTSRREMRPEKIRRPDDSTHKKPRRYKPMNDRPPPLSSDPKKNKEYYLKHAMKPKDEHHKPARDKSPNFSPGLVKEKQHLKPGMDDHVLVHKPKRDRSFSPEAEKKSRSSSDSIRYKEKSPPRRYAEHPRPLPPRGIVPVYPMPAAMFPPPMVRMIPPGPPSRLPYILRPQ